MSKHFDPRNQVHLSVELDAECPISPLHEAPLFSPKAVPRVAQTMNSDLASTSSLSLQLNTALSDIVLVATPGYVNLNAN